MCVFALTGEALTQSSLLEADGENMTTAVEPMNLHHAMLRSPGSVCTHRAVALQSALVFLNHDCGAGGLEEELKIPINCELPAALSRFSLKFLLLVSLVPLGAADSVVVLSQPDELVTMATEGHGYGEDVVALL